MDSSSWIWGQHKISRTWAMFTWSNFFRFLFVFLFVFVSFIFELTFSSTFWSLLLTMFFYFFMFSFLRLLRGERLLQGMLLKNCGHGAPNVHGTASPRLCRSWEGMWRRMKVIFFKEKKGHEKEVTSFFHFLKKNKEKKQCAWGVAIAFSLRMWRRGDRNQLSLSFIFRFSRFCILFLVSFRLVIALLAQCQNGHGTRRTAVLSSSTDRTTPPLPPSEAF